jgi:transposase
MIALDELVPANHLVRNLEAAIDFSFMYPLVKDMYSEVGPPSIDPIILIKMAFIQYIFGISSLRKTIEEIETNMAYRWFLGYGFHDKIPHFSTFGKNYERRFKDTDLFDRFFIEF